MTVRLTFIIGGLYIASNRLYNPNKAGGYLCEIFSSQESFLCPLGKTIYFTSNQKTKNLLRIINAIVVSVARPLTFIAESFGYTQSGSGRELQKLLKQLIQSIQILPITNQQTEKDFSLFFEAYRKRLKKLSSHQKFFEPSLFVPVVPRLSDPEAGDLLKKAFIQFQPISPLDRLSLEKTLKTFAKIDQVFAGTYGERISAYFSQQTHIWRCGRAAYHAFLDFWWTQKKHRSLAT